MAGKPSANRRQRVAPDIHVKKYTNEIHSADSPIIQPPPVSLELPREPESIVLATEDVLAGNTYAQELAFNEEFVQIRLEPSSEKNPPKFEMFGNQGNQVWVPYGVPFVIKRKFVEIMARCKHDDISTEIIKHDDSEQNNALRNSRSKYPFSMLRDDNPKGRDWLQNLLMER